MKDFLKILGQGVFAIVVGLCIIATIDAVGCAAISYLHSLDKITDVGCFILSTAVQISSAYIAYVFVINNYLNKKEKE